MYLSYVSLPLISLSLSLGVPSISLLPPPSICVPCLLKQVDVEKVKLLVWALYALQGTPLHNCTTSPGIIRTDGTRHVDIIETWI